MEIHSKNTMAEHNQEEKEHKDSIEFIKEKIGICQHNLITVKGKKTDITQKFRNEEDNLNHLLAYWELQIDQYHTTLENLKKAARDGNR